MKTAEQAEQGYYVGSELYTECEPDCPLTCCECGKGEDTTEENGCLEFVRTIYCGEGDRQPYCSDCLKAASKASRNDMPEFTVNIIEQSHGDGTTEDCELVLRQKRECGITLYRWAYVGVGSETEYAAGQWTRDHNQATRAALAEPPVATHSPAR